MQVNQSEFAELRILVVGCGSIGKRHVQVLTEIGVQYLACCDPSATQREILQGLFPHIQMYENYDIALREFKPKAIFILTPTRMHVAMAKTALLSGCHVFIEKPLSNSSDGVEDLKALAEKLQLKVMIGFCFRYHKVLKMAKELLDQNTIGRLINIRALMGEHFPEIHPDYLNMYYSKYSGAFELIHDLDLAIWFANQNVKEAYSVYGSFSNIGIEAPDSIELLLGFEDRMAATVHLDFFQFPRRRQMELIGTKGVIIVEFASWDTAEISYYTADARQWVAKKYTTARNDMFRDENIEFLNAITHDGEITCTIDEAVKSLKVIESVYKPY